MRDLTEEELKLAPEWATHYQIFRGSLIWESEDKYQNRWMLKPKPQKSKLTKCKPIPEIKIKPFDISEHEFGDTVEYIESDGCELSLYCAGGFRHVELYKDDAIAIAKALGVTGEDLK